MVTAVASFVASKITAAVIVGTGSTSLAVAQTVYAVAYYGTQLAITVGASVAAQKLAEAALPDPEAAKASLKQPIPPRIRGYGRRRIGGSFLLWEAQANYGYDVVAIHHGRIEGYDELWLFDRKLTFVGGGLGGWVVGTTEYGGGGKNDLIHVDTRLGAVPETPYGPMVAALGAGGVWTEDHRCDGIATIGADYHHAKKENLIADFPNGLLLQWSAVARLAPAWDPRDSGQSRADPASWPTSPRNLALQILDFLWNAPGGMRLDYETTIAPALDHWIGEADICDEDVPLKAGGTEKRYWGSLYYALPGDPQDTLDKMLAACDGRLTTDAAGVVRLWVGKVRAPTVHLTDADIADYDIQMDAAAYDVVNEIVPTYVSEAHGWTMQEATPWRSAADVAARGKGMSKPLPLEAVNSSALSQRLAKREGLRQLVEIRGSLVGRLSCLRALGHRWVALTLDELGIDGLVIEIQKGAKASWGAASVVLPFAAVPEGIDDWDAGTEEDATLAPPRPDADALTPPVLTSATPFTQSLGGSDGVRLALVGSGPDRDDLTWTSQTRAVGDESWAPAEVVDETPGAGFSGASGFVASVAALEVRIGYETGGGSGVQWSDALVVDSRVTAPTVTPPPSSLSAVSPAAGTLRVTYRDPASAAAYCIVRTNTAATLTGATAEPPSPQAGLYALRSVDLSRPAGNHYVWVTAYDAADVPSTMIGPVGPVSVG